nr:FtsX-like permease family protein [Planctomycetota bacterium]
RLAWQPRPDETAQRAERERTEAARGRWIVAIAILVTTISIANSMLMSVTERFREIGTMKCLGAPAAFIRQIFFLESALLGVVGGVAGAVLGGVASVIGYAATYGPGPVFAGMAWGTLCAHLTAAGALSVVLAVTAAVYPAAVAARMRPSDALRSSV